MFCLVILFMILVVLLLTSVYTRLTYGMYRNRSDMVGKVVLITGGTAGIGESAAEQIAQLRANVVLAVRNVEKGLKVAKRIREKTGNPNVVVYECDVSSLKSVRRFATEFQQKEQKLDVLILNAGISGGPGRHLTDEGLELHLATNHLGHFLLTNLLLEILLRNDNARVVVVSSALHTLGNIDFDNLNFEDRVLSPPMAYSNTKLMNLLFVKELSRRLKQTKVCVNALHPGTIKTSIAENTPPFPKLVFQVLCFLYGMSPEIGAQTIVYLAAAKEVEGITGEYFQDCQPCRHSLKAKDAQLAKRLWETSSRLVGLNDA